MIYLQKLLEDGEKRPSSPQQQGQHGFSRVHVQTPLVLILIKQRQQKTQRQQWAGGDIIVVTIQSVTPADGHFSTEL